MMSPKFSTRLARLALACVLLSSSLHAPASAQRRRQPARNNTTTTHPAPAPTPRVETGAQPAHADAQTQTQQGREPDSSIEELLSADAYGAYAEVRRLGTLAQSEEIKTGIAALRLFGDETKPLTDLVGFVEENTEALADSRAVVVSLPTRAGLPQALFGLEMASNEAAVAFEPKFRRLLGQQTQMYRELLGGPQAAAPPRRAQRPGGRETPSPKTDATAFAYKRAGRWLLAADAPFTLKRLRGNVDASALAEDSRFQSARTRFGSDALFVYVDTTLAQQGWAFQQQKEQEAREAAAAKAQAEEQKHGVFTGKIKEAQTVTVQTPAVIEQPAPSVADTSPSPEASPTPTPSPEVVVDESNAIVDPVITKEAIDDMPVEDAVVRKPTEEEIAVGHLSSVLSGLWGGIPRIPGAVALGVGLGGGTLAIRVAVENPSDGTINVIPFLPNVISGAPVTAAATEVAPDDADIFFATSLDWMQIYTSTLGTASLSPSYNLTGNMIGRVGDDEDDESRGAASNEKPPTPDETIALIEKLFRFKFKEDLLPSLGDEVAISMPLDIFGGSLIGSRRSVEKKEEKDSEPGFVFIISLNNPEKIREILPRVMAALTLAVPDPAGGGASERREGIEIRASSGVAYAIINNFLVASTEVKAVRHVVDSFAARRTLAASNAYRDATSWQARQKLVQAYVSEALMRGATEDTKKRSGGSTDPVVRALLAQLDMPPQPVSYETTNEGDALVHELRLPVDMLKAYATAIIIGVKDAPVITGEAMAVYALNRIGYAEEQYKSEHKKERFGTLEELIAEGVLEKDFLERLEYKLELNVSAEKYEATATPKNYGKTGRRSFFTDEVGMVRAADHRGRPATVEDPPVN